MEVKVKGHSGCQVDIIYEENSLFVYKTTYNKDYMERLMKQAEKQKIASHSEYPHIRIPQIYRIDENLVSVSIKMEYVYSKNFIEYFEAAGIEQISYFVDALKLFLEREIKESSLELISSDILKRKFEDVCARINLNPLLSNDSDIQLLLNKSLPLFREMNDLFIPIGRCHGDLTFSNILFNGNNYYLIDFLDSFVESPLLDIVKIRQDSAYLWSQLMYIDEYDKIRLQIISNKIDQEITGYFSKYDWYNQFYDIFQLMNFLRILQYAREKEIINFLKNVIGEIIDEF